MRGSPARRERSTVGYGAARPAAARPPVGSETAHRTGTERSAAHRGITGRTAGALLAAALVLTGCTGGGSDDDAARHGGAHGGKRPGTERSPLWDTHPDSIASLGDSITRGFDACSVLSDCPEASWSTGTEVDSLARRLLPGGDATAGTHSWNYAKTGAVASNLPGQVDSAIAQKPELVTVMIGANDACRDTLAHMTSTAAFRADVTVAMKALRRALPRTQVYMASVPDLERLWSQGRKNPLGRTIWRLGICPSMLKDSDSMSAATVERRSAVSRRVDEYNVVLKDVCEHDKLCRYDRAVHAYRFRSADLSKWDWFHPSKEGQRQLADMAYRRVTAKTG